MKIPTLTATFICLIGFTSCDGDSGGVDPVSNLPRISISDFEAPEGDGDGVFIFDLGLSTSSNDQVSVEYTTREKTAGEDEDFEKTLGQVVFAPGENRARIEIKIVGDTLLEQDEKFEVVLSDPVNAELNDATGVGTIRNDDIYVVIPDEGYSTPDEYAGYDLVWSDEFDGTQIEADNWTHEIGTGNGGWGNNESQYYTDRVQNSYVDKGKLVIVAQEEEFEGSGYTSARMITRDKQEYLFGRIDVRAQLPEGQGIWPAIWMLGANITDIGWPACGEIDIMELVGHEPSTVHGTAHWGPRGQSWSFNQGRGKSISGEKFSDKFHVFTILWEPDKITWLLDDQEYFVLTKEVVNGDYPFNQPFFFILNIAVGGNWPGYPDNTTVFPQTMIVDYVRVFQLK